MRRETPVDPVTYSLDRCALSETDRVGEVGLVATLLGVHPAVGQGVHILALSALWAKGVNQDLLDEA